jgi:hypothetical protein
MRQPQNHNVFAYIFTPRIITGCWLSLHRENNRIQLRSYHKKIIDHLELEHLYIFNPTRIGSLIASWYHATKQKMPIAYALAGPSIYEKIVPTTTAHPTPNQLPISPALHLQWEHAYLYSYDSAHYFYLCGIQKTLLFQYQLLAIRMQLPLHSITTQGMALLDIYRYLFGSTYRPAQLAMALTKCNNNIEQLFSRDDLARLLMLPAQYNLSPSDIIPLLTACGLFVAEG